MATGPARFCCTRAIPSTGCGAGWVSSWSIPPRSTWPTWAAPARVELDRLDPSTLDDARLVEAFTSAAGLRDDARTARLASELLKRRPALLDSLDLTSVVSPLVRLAIARDDQSAAVDWLKQVRSISTGNTAKTLDIWLAQVYARAGQPDQATDVYVRLIKSHASDAVLALDAGEMMLDNGHQDQASLLLMIAGDTAAREHRAWIVRRVRQLLDRIP